MAQIDSVTFDCRHAGTLARFWTQVLDDYEVAPYDDDEIARLAAAGIDDVVDDPNVMVVADTGPRMFFITVPEPKTVKNRVHIDLRTDDSAAEVARVVALGATLLGEFDGWVTLADPEGNEFCIMRS